mmetsp:Transcript_30511/g.97344  ORF Transcript_30511/g.97344 Transcript_30511/m.97344 type:complete len:290 (+) Transcript_30511:2886-3755(+)
MERRRRRGVAALRRCGGAAVRLLQPLPPPFFSLHLASQSWCFYCVYWSALRARGLEEAEELLGLVLAGVGGGALLVVARLHLLLDGGLLRLALGARGIVGPGQGRAAEDGHAVELALLLELVVLIVRLRARVRAALADALALDVLAIPGAAAAHHVRQLLLLLARRVRGEEVLGAGLLPGLERAALELGDARRAEVLALALGLLLLLNLLPLLRAHAARHVAHVDRAGAALDARGRAAQRGAGLEAGRAGQRAQDHHRAKHLALGLGREDRGASRRVKVTGAGGDVGGG